MLNKLNSILNSAIIEKQKFINAYISTLSEDETIALIEPSLEEPYKLRRPILYKMQNDIQNNFQEKHRLLLVRLLELLNKSKANLRNTIATYIKELLVAFPDNESAYFIKKVLKNNYVTVRRRAYALLRNHWIPECQETLIEIFHKYNDIEAARIIINSLPVSTLESFFNSLHIVTSNNFCQRKLYLRLLDKSPSVIERLKDEDPVSYIYLRHKANTPLTHQETIKLFYKAHPHSDFGLMIWAIGKMGLRKTLDELLSIWPEKEKEIYQIQLEK